MTIRTLLTGVALAASVLVASPVPALAAETKAPAGVGALAAAADGKLYAYHGINYANRCNSWTGNAANWGACRNATASLWNNGFVGSFDDVYVYWGTGQTGTRRGVRQGAALSDLRDWRFELDGQPGQGQALYNNVSSHKWVNL